MLIINKLFAIEVLLLKEDTLVGFITKSSQLQSVKGGEIFGMYTFSMQFLLMLSHVSIKRSGLIAYYIVG